MRHSDLTAMSAMIVSSGEREEVQRCRAAMRPSHRMAKALAAFLLLGGALQAGDWQLGTVTGSVGGNYTSLRMDNLGNAHVAYCDTSQDRLQYSFWDHSLGKWFNTTVGRCNGFTSLALDSKQHPHISYPGSQAGNLVHVYWNGSAWITQPVDLHALVIDYYTSITLDANDNPSISYYEEVASPARDIGVGRRLRVVTWNGKAWEARTVDSDQGSGKFNSMATDSKGYPQIAYGNVSYENQGLRYGRWNGRAWEVEIVEGKGGTPMWAEAIAVGKDDVPHIAYTDVTKKTLKYATKRNGKWQLEVVDRLGDVATPGMYGYPDRNGIALDEQGNVYISYYDCGRGQLRVAHQKDRKWVIEVVDQNSGGFTSSLQINQGNLWLTYASEDGLQLKIARRPLQQDDAPPLLGELP